MAGEGHGLGGRNGTGKPGSIVSLADIATDRGSLANLPRATLVNLRREAAYLVADLDHALTLAESVSVAPPEPDGLLLIRDACKRMGWSYGYAVRHWSELGGFKDVDGKLKIRPGVLRHHAPKII